MHPGSDASVFKRAVLLEWREELYARMRAHVERVQAWAKTEGRELSAEECEPACVAFTGVTQFAELFEPARLKGVVPGKQSLRPPRFPYTTSEIWVLPSSSGRAAMTNERREAPYIALGERLEREPLPPDSPLLPAPETDPATHLEKTTALMYESR